MRFNLNRPSTPSILPCQPSEHALSTVRAHLSGAQPRSGFALVVALVLMGFILMLVLSLGSLARVDIARANIEQDSQNARRNALLALNIALGQLQQYAGPDRHISARSDMPVPSGGYEDGDDEETPSPSIQHPYWTGIWGGTRSNFKLQTYLVSGNQDPADPLAVDATTSMTEAESVTLLSATDTVSEAGKVIAKKVVINENNREVGAYAYWISDEGIKAKVNLAQVAPESAPRIDNFSLISPQQFGVNQIGGLTWFPMNDTAKIEALVNSDTLKLLADDSAAGDPTTIHNRFHDVTFYSYGVLSDSKDGGLKRDLTVGLADGASTPSGQIFGSVSDRDDYTPLGSLTDDEDPGGPTWNQLRSWVNTALVSGALPVRTATDDEVGYAPIIAGFQMYYVPTYNDTVPTTNNNYLAVSMQVLPAVVLWNPYDVPLETASYRVLTGRASSDEDRLSILSTSSQNGYIVLQEGMNGDVPKLEALGNPATKQITPRITNPNSYDHNFTFDFFINNLKLAPGEAIVFSPSSNRDFYSASGAKRILEPGFRYFGYSTPLRTGNSSNDPLRKLVEGDHDNDTATPPEPLRSYQFVGINPTRVAGIQLFREDGGSKLLSDIVYLNQARPEDDQAPPAGVMNSNPGSNDPIITSGNNVSAIGWKVVRRFSTLNDSLFSGHLAPPANQKWLVDLNPRASTSGPNQLNYSLHSNVYNYSSINNPSVISLLEAEPNNIGIDHSSSSDNAFIGLSETNDTQTGNITSTILFEAPKGIDKLFSIGQLTHAPLYYWNQDNAAAKNPKRIKHRMQSSRFDNLIPAYPLGNSRANPAIPLDNYYQNFGSIENPHSGDEKGYFSFKGALYDYSWLLNDALLDAYFFSSLIADGDDESEAPAYTPHNPRIVALANTTDLTPGWETSAANLLVDGAFNINSTSVEAWKAVLSSFYGQKVEHGGSPSSTTHTDKSPFLRISKPGSSALDDQTSPAPTSQQAYDGYRALNSTQIQELATAIVKQVKLRGPFPSMAAFVNRSLSGPTENQLQGALSAAIADTNINAALAKSTYESTNENSGYPRYNDAASAGHTTEALPGWLTSADLIARLGSVLTARSDTFLIRAYGESTGSNGEVESKAWCEAVVQRLPDYVDSAEKPQTEPDSLNAINEAFGRRFAVVSFRWLSESEL